MRQQTGNKGFTLIELLIVIGIIGFLAAAVLVAVDPVKRIQDSRDARRSSEVNAILNAVLTKQVDDRAVYNGGPGANMITHATNAQVIVTSTTGISCATAATRPACPTKTLSTTGRDCVVNLADAGTLSGTLANTGTAVTGTGTFFLNELRAGDVVTDGADSCTVASVASNTAFTCTLAPSPSDFAGGTATVARSNSAVFPTYIAQIPLDPTGGTPTAGNLAIGATNSGYYLHRTNGNRIEIGSCYPEQNAAINVKR